MIEGMDWSDIGERVRESRLAAGLSQDELGARIDLERTKIAKIESGDRRVDALELSRLASALGVPMGHLLHRPPQVLSRRTQLVDDTNSDVARQSYQIEAALLAWLRDVRQLVDLAVLNLRPSLTYCDPVSDADGARKAALWMREKLGIGLEPIETLMAVCEQAGQLVLVADIGGEGASLVDGDAAVAVVSAQLEPGRRRTTAAHELGHLVMGDEYSSDLGVNASRADRENVIDAFAAELLLPSEVVSTAHSSTDLRGELVKLAATYRTSWSLVTRQADHIGVLDHAQQRRWSLSSPTRAELRESVGWAPQPDLDTVKVPPSYAHAVMQAWEKDYITPVRAVELMHGQIVLEDLPAKSDLELEP